MVVKIGVLVSGGGTNLQALLDAEASGRLASGKISLVASWMTSSSESRLPSATHWR